MNRYALLKTMATLGLETPNKFKQFDGRISISYDTAASQKNKKDMWCVDQPFYFYLNGKNQHSFVYVPKGFLTDGASVPRIFWSIIPPWGIYGNAAIIHDYLCKEKTIIKDGVRVHIKNKEIDDIFLDAMTVSGTGIIKYPIYYSVRLWDILGLR